MRPVFSTDFRNFFKIFSPRDDIKSAFSGHPMTTEKKNLFFEKLFLKKGLTSLPKSAIIYTVVNIGASPSGKATDSDSVIT